MAMATLMWRTLTVTRAPIFKSLSRMLPAVAISSRVLAAGPPERLDEDAGDGGKPQAQLVGVHGGRRGVV